ncbi:MAG TPA: hypothetical protein VMU54_15650 [Planctomycetota bacterium]|nr:hypothetical protein [Planctomycetota bacterium]
MKKMCCLLLLASSGCVYPAYTIRRPFPTEPPVSKEEIIRMSSAGLSEPVMIDLLEKRGANALTPDDLVALKNAGTPDSVVQKAIASERKVVERVVDDYYAYPYYPYYGYPYYGASFSYGFGWGYGGYYYGGYPRGYMGVRVYR